MDESLGEQDAKMSAHVEKRLAEIQDDFLASTEKKAQEIFDRNNRHVLAELARTMKTVAEI